MIIPPGTRRSFLRGAIALAVSVALHKPTEARQPRGFATGAPPITFDFFIGPNGDDNNNGLTPATAWSITALNTKQSTYSGKKIGFVGDAGVALSSFALTGTAGQFSCAATTLAAGQYVMIAGTFGGTGSISGYASGTTYVIAVTNGTTTGTLASLSGAVGPLGGTLTTTAGTPSGLTCLLNQPIQQGTVGGVHTSIFSLVQAISNGTSPALGLNGGPSSSVPTYMASCTSAGVYSPRWAIIDASDPSTGSPPTVAGSIMGQDPNATVSSVAHYGNLTLDALTIRFFSFAAVYINAITSPQGLIIQNNHVHSGSNAPSNNNPGAIWIDSINNSQILNNKIHDLTTSSGGTTFPLGQLGFIQFNTTGTLITNNTFYNGLALSMKDNYQSWTASYNYLGYGAFGDAYNGSGGAGGVLLKATVHNFLAGTGKVSILHHNIIMGPIHSDGESSQQNEGTARMYNNTFYQGTSSTHKIVAFYTDLGNAGGTWDFYNNIVYSPFGYEGFASSHEAGSITMTGVTSAWIGQFDFNYYGNAGSGVNQMSFGWGLSSGQFAQSLPAWLTHLSSAADAHSTLGANPFSGTPAEGDYLSFNVSGACTTAGVGGACCGANDGSGAIGCNF
jgi:hypothetical protein